MRARVHLKHVLHGGDEGGVGIRRDHPLLLEMRLENVFFSVRPIVLSLARSTMFSSTTLSSSSRSVHFARPRGGAEQAKAISLASFSPSKIRALAEVARCLRVSAASKPSSTNCWRVRHTVARLVSSAFTIWLSLHPSPALDVSAFLQQDTRLHQKLRGALAGADQFMQMPAFVAGQFHDVLFYAYLFGSHESPPVIGPRAIDSRIKLKINDGGH